MRHPTDLQKFLMGFPLFGPNKRAHRRFRKEVTARPEDCMALWQQDEQTLSVRDGVIDALLQGGLGWKSRKFIPADPCDIVFLDTHDGMDLLDTMCRIEKRFGLKLGEDILLRMESGMTLGEFVDIIPERRREALAKGLPTEESGKGKDWADRLGMTVAVVCLLLWLALMLLGNRFTEAFFGPVFQSWGLTVVGALGAVNTVLGLVVWVRKGKKMGAGVILATILSFLVALVLLEI